MTDNIEKTQQTGLNPTSDESIVADLIKNLPSQEELVIELPSRGKFYSLGDSSHPITLRPMTFEDEKSMASTQNANIDVINLLLSRCLTNININELLVIDKLFVIMKLREISYGHEYKVKINCPQCRKENNVTIDLGKLNIRMMEEDSSNPVVVTLPVLGKEAKIRLPRVIDEKYLNTLDGTASNIWRFVEEIDGHNKKTIISAVLKKLPIKDMHTILGVLNGEEYGVDPEVRFACRYCSHHESITLPINTDFFTSN